MAAVGPWLNAELNRDKKKHKKPFTLAEWTITGLTRPKKKRRRVDPGSLFASISGSMRALGGVDDVNSSR
jgi:hypothetical protein